ncbi:MAG: hypothetical protein JO263_11510 [Candidatus Eremiobacteraeota bacterium]|nr:hypothetical protein [Candidatus Eremiobacteraeota bacterium]
MLHSRASYTWARRFGAAAALSAVLAGCSASTTLPPSVATVRSGSSAARSAGRLSPDARRHRKGFIYWGNFDTSTITVYSARGLNGNKEGQITAGLSNPQRLFVDAAHNLYATNIGNDTIVAYQQGQTSPFLTISAGVNSPTGVTVDAAGTVYCANAENNTITVYPHGQTSPTLTIRLFATPEYLATDASDNLYVSVGTWVYEYVPGATTGKNLGLNVSAPGALEVDKAGNLIVLDRNTIDYFPAGSTQPSKQIKVTAGVPFAFSLSADEKTLYVSVNHGKAYVIQEISYPNGTALTNKLTTNAGDWPLAVSPDNVLGG